VDTIAASLVTFGVPEASSGAAAYAVLFLITLMVLVLFSGMTGKKKKKGRSAKRGDNVLLLGPCGSGKTACFFALRGGDVPETVSSLDVNRAAAQIGGEERLVVDFPGHQRYKSKAMDEVKNARCVVYLIDSTEKQHLRDAAEQLYDLMTFQELIDRRIPLLVVANKKDIPGARKETQVEDELRREIERMRKSRVQTLDGDDAADQFLGIEGEQFKFDHAPTPVSFVAASISADVSPVADFIAETFA
jgi:signal recognition particle receptor subunit beta